MFRRSETGVMDVRITQLRRLSHLAWVVLEIIEIAELVRQRERCLGDVRAAHLVIRDGTLHRARDGVLLRLRDRCAVTLHERGRHDPGCELLGVSHRALRNIVNGARGVGARVLLDEAIEAGIEDCIHLRAQRQIALASWERLHGPVRNAEFVRACIERVIEPVTPPNDVSPPRKHSRGRHDVEKTAKFRVVPRNSLPRAGSSPG